MLTEINGNIDATYPIITGELTGYLGPIGTVTASADNSVGTPHVVVTQTPTPDGLDIDFAFKEMGIPGLDLTVEQDLTEEQQQTARENIDAQEVLTFDNVPTSGSSNPVTSAGIYAADEDLKDYVDDSINRSSAFFRGNFGTYAALMAVPWQTTDPDAPNFVSNNDYAAVADDETHSHESWRYIYVLEEGGQDNGWTAQYRINESPFTVEQLAAINSGITANDVTKLAGIEQGAQVNTVTGVKGDAEANYRTGNINITKANIGLGNVDNTSDLNKPVSTAQQAAIEAATKALYDVKSAGPAAIVSIHDAEAIPVKSLIAQITPVQSGSGDPSPDNIRPITGWTGANINATGINLWDEEYLLGAWILSDGTFVSYNDRLCSKNKIAVKPNTTYYFKTRTGLVSGNVIYYAQDETFISSAPDVGNQTFTTPSNCYYINISIGSAYGATYNNDVSINYPSTDTSYHSGTSNKTVNIDWTSEAGTVYGGTLTYIGGGKYSLQANMGSVDLGTLNWTADANVLGNFYSDNYSGNMKIVSSGVAFNGLCEIYKSVPLNTVSATNNGMAISSNPRIYIRDERYIGSSGSDFKAALNGLYLYYELATLPDPIILDAEDVKTLLGDNNIFCDTGDVQVTYETGTVAVALADLYEKLAAQIGA